MTVKPRIDRALERGLERLHESLIPIVVWLASGMLLLLATEFSMAVMPEFVSQHFWKRFDTLSAMAAWHGQELRVIMQQGYDLSGEQTAMHSAVFPPVYPLLSRWLSGWGMRYEAALVLVSNVAFLMMLIAFYHYLRDRGFSTHESGAALTLLAISPYSFFFRMTYSESLLCLLATLYFLGTLRQWHPLWLAAIVGLAGATRVIGVVLIPILMVETWQRFPGITRWFKSGAAGLIGASGMLFFMLHLQDVQGDALAVVKGQAFWTMREEGSLIERVWNAVSCQPLIDAYRPDCVCYWGNSEPSQLPLVNMQFMNPISLVVAGVLITYGWRQRILTVRELVFCLFVVSIPYFTQGYRICLHSQSRYVLAAFPLAIVAVRLLDRLSTWAVMPIVSVMAVLQFGNIALFTSNRFTY
jgi:hypothetical protein